jgi:photosystem II stability/assembly factor-like uncharacterized protein
MKEALLPPIRLRLCPFLIVLALALSPAPRLSAQPYTWTPTGPFGGTVGSLVIHPNNPQVLYAGAEHGVFQSTDAGSSWRLLPGSPVLLRPNLLALDPARPKVLYVAGSSPAGRGIFRSVDGGSSWKVVSRNLPSSFSPEALAVEPSPAARLYVSTFGRGILRSTDGGVTWQEANQGIPPAFFINLLVAPPRPSGTVFAGGRDGLYRTVNGGASWTRLSRGLPVSRASALAVSASDPKTLYASFESGIYRSTDGGDSWTATGASLPGIERIAVHPRSPRTVYAGGFYAGGVFKSTDGGAHWTATALPPRIRVRALAATPAATLYVGAAAPDLSNKGTDPGGVFRSADGGASWTRVNQGLADLTALSAAIDPGNSNVLLAGLSGPGLFRTSNRGAGWTRTSFGLPALQNSGVQASKVLATAPGVFYAVEPTVLSSNQLRKSTDGGLTWNPLPDLGFIAALLADPLERETLYALASEGLTRSVDGGASWTVLSNSLPEMCALSKLAVVRPSASQPAVFWAVGSRPVDLSDGFTHCQAAAFRSLDLGASWVAMDAGLTDELGTSVATIAATPQAPHTLYLGMGDGAGGAWKSTDDGVSWHPAGLGGSSVITFAFAPAPGVLWAGTPDRVFRSADGGATWEDRSGNRGGQLGDPPVAILLDPTHGRVYLAGSGGVWVSGQQP